MLSIILIIMIIVIVLYKLLIIINDRMLFHPIKGKVDKQYYQEMEEKYNIIVNDGLIKSTDGCTIHFIYLKKSGKDKLYLFAHGNAGNILNRIESVNIQFLLQHGSVIMFDYRGYGCSTGDPSEKGVKDDILAVWRYAINNLNYRADDIILYGESLGCSCVSWLVYYLSNNNDDLPKGIIMQSGFYSLKKIVSDILHPYLSYLVVNEFDNSKYIKNIKDTNKDYPILLFHSKNDGLIDYDHSHRLSIENKCSIHEIYGTHNEPIFDEKINQTITKYFKN